MQAAGDYAGRAAELDKTMRQIKRMVSVALHSDAAAEAWELIRGLIDTITLHPDCAGQRIEVRGELSAILGIASNRPCSSAPDLAGQIKLVAGTRNHLDLLSG